VPRSRHEDVEVRGLGLLLVQELQRRVEDVLFLLVRAEHEVQRVADFVAPEVPQQLLVMRDLVETLPHGPKRLLVDALDSHVHVQEAGPAREIEVGRVETEVRGDQRGPADLQGDQRLHQSHGVCPVARELARREEDVPASAAANVVRDLLDGAGPVSEVPVQAALGAEVAGVGAASRVLDDVRPVEDVLRRIEQVPSQPGQAVERRRSVPRR
jgi:hypothetical protein